MIVNNANFGKNVNLKTADFNNNTNYYKLGETKEDSFEIQNQNSKKSPNLKKKIIAGLAIAGTVALSAYAVYKGKQRKILKEMPADLKPLFKELKGKDGKEFVDSAYNGLVKHFGLDDIAPKAVNLSQKPDGLFNTITGGYNPMENTIEFSQGFLKKLKKDQQFNLLSHELKHCKQFTDIIRTEGLGIDELAKVYTEKMTAGVKVASSQPVSGKVIEQKIAEYKDKVFNETKEALEKAFKGISEKKIPANSGEASKAKEYLEAFKNYEGLGIFGTGSEKYRNNLLETEAYAIGDKMEKWFKGLSSPFDRVKDFIKVLKNQ